MEAIAEHSGVRASGGKGTGVSETSSRRWKAGVVGGAAYAAFARSATVSVAAQKKDGEATQPIGRVRGKATS